MGHRSSHPASLPFRVLTVGVVVCVGLIVPAPATALSATSAVEAPSPAGAAAPVGVNECHSTDNGDPRLVEFRYGPSMVNVVNAKALVRFRIRVRDTGGPGPASGVRSVMVWFGRAEAGEDIGTEGQELSKAADGWWTGSVTVPRKAPHRRWPVEGLVLRDRVGNAKNYSRAALTKILGRAPGVSITTAPDRTSPHLTAFSVTPETVDSRAAVRYVTFTARMVDVQSDVDWVVVDGADDTSWLSPETGSISLEKVPGRPHLFSARVPVARWVGNRQWRTTAVWAWNSANLLALYSRRQLVERAFSGDFTVRSELDAARAEARSFEVSATALDVRTTDASVSFRTRVTDAGSGVHSVSVSAESENIWVPLTRIAGTPADGVWSGTTRIRHCRTTSATWPLQLVVTDGNGEYDNWRTYDAGQLAAHGWQDDIRVTGGDLERPWVIVPSRVRRAGAVRLTFREVVQDLDATKARVHPVRSDGSLGRAVPGTWRCVDGRGDRANCATGSVRDARLWPARPFRVGARYAVLLNPEHFLGITDLAGNPVRQTARRLRVVR